jgi:acyl carrier protein
MSSTLSDLLALIQEKFDIDPAQVDPDRPLDEYGLDSLSKAELLFAIEDRFGFEYPEQYTAVNTLRALAEVVTKLRTPAVA